MFLFRKTYGWGKKEDTISLSQWGEGTDAKRHHVMASLNTLIEKKIIYRRLDKGQTPTYGFNKYVEEWEGIEADTKRGERFHKDEELLPEQVTVTNIGNTLLPKQVTELLPKQVHTKERKKVLKKILGALLLPV
jgi:phage replication O-like protein O